MKVGNKISDTINADENDHLKCQSTNKWGASDPIKIKLQYPNK